MVSSVAAIAAGLVGERMRQPRNRQQFGLFP
jgi:hypothetical protein